MTDTMQTLRCAEGHEWTRPTRKGKPPATCPEHSKFACDENGKRTSGVVLEALDLLTGDEYVEHELRLKLEYCVEHVDDRHADTQLLTERQHELIREHKRMKEHHYA